MFLNTQFCVNNSIFNFGRQFAHTDVTDLGLNDCIYDNDLYCHTPNYFTEV